MQLFLVVKLYKINKQTYTYKIYWGFNSLKIVYSFFRTFFHIFERTINLWRIFNHSFYIVPFLKENKKCGGKTWLTFKINNNLG